MINNLHSKIISKQISADLLTPVLALIKIQSQFPSHHFLFESVEKGNNRGRYSVIGVLPDLIWKCENNIAYINSDFEKNSEAFTKSEIHPISCLRNLINESQIKGDCPILSSGIFGYMGYDMARLMEKLPDLNLPDDIQIPDSIFIRPQILIVFDGLFDVINIHAPIYQNGENRAEENINKVIQILNNPVEIQQVKKLEQALEFKSNFSEKEYCAAVEKSQEYIKDGDIFQVLPSQRFTSDFANENALHFYRSLRRVNPSPFLFYVKFDDFCLTGSSPEIMVAVKNKKMTVRPLAGTRKRGENEIEDKKIAAELLSDEKEVAEHLMLIDLGRHDVGRVCKAGSVKLTEKMVVENYSHVMHISSNVEGILDEKYDALDALISGFPAGTVSGAPKIRAMEIIEELEKCKRGFYAGCVGYFTGNGDMETCITLRSALIKDNKIHLQSGAGVVFDSVPKSEYQECLNKAAALMAAAEKVFNF